MALDVVPARDALTLGDGRWVTRPWLRWLTTLRDLINGITGEPAETGYSAADFTAGDFGDGGVGATMTVTVAEADVLTNRFRRAGNRLWWSFVAVSITTGGTAQQRIRLALPDGLTAPAVYQSVTLARVVEGGVVVAAFGQVEPSAPSYLGILKQDATDWALGGSNEIQFTIELEVVP